MSEKEDQEDYKKRMKELVERVEKTKDKNSKYTEQDIIEAKQRLLQSIKRRTQQDKYRSERIIVVLTYWIKGIYQYKEDHIPIDTLYELIYQQLKKPKILIPNLDPNRNNFLELVDKRRILRNMEVVLGEEHIKQFRKKYNLKKLVGSDSIGKKFFYLIVIIGICSFPILLGVWYLFRLSK